MNKNGRKIFLMFVLMGGAFCLFCIVASIFATDQNKGYALRGVGFFLLFIFTCLGGALGLYESWRYRRFCRMLESAVCPVSDEYIEKAENYLNDVVMDGGNRRIGKLIIVRDSVFDGGSCWILSYQSEKWFRSGDGKLSLLGKPALKMSKTGEVLGWTHL